MVELGKIGGFSDFSKQVTDEARLIAWAKSGGMERLENSLRMLEKAKRLTEKELRAMNRHGRLGGRGRKSQDGE